MAMKNLQMKENENLQMKENDWFSNEKYIRMWQLKEKAMNFQMEIGDPLSNDEWNELLQLEEWWRFADDTIYYDEAFENEDGDLQM